MKTIKTCRGNLTVRVSAYCLDDASSNPAGGACPPGQFFWPNVDSIHTYWFQLKCADGVGEHRDVTYTLGRPVRETRQSVLHNRSGHIVQIPVGRPELVIIQLNIFSKLTKSKENSQLRANKVIVVIKFLRGKKKNTHNSRVSTE